MRTFLAVALVGLGACGGGDGGTDYMEDPDACGTPTTEQVAAGEYSLDWQCIEGNCDSPSAIEAMPGSADVPSSSRATISTGPNFPGVYFDDAALWIWTRTETECLSLRSVVTTPGGASSEVGRLCSTSSGAFGWYATPDSRWLLCATR